MAYQTIILWTKEHGVVPDDTQAQEILLHDPIGFRLDHWQHHPGENE
jgi:hypothetical protein